MDYVKLEIFDLDSHKLRYQTVIEKSKVPTFVVNTKKNFQLGPIYYLEKPVTIIR